MATLPATSDDDSATDSSTSSEEDMNPPEYDAEAAPPRSVLLLDKGDGGLADLADEGSEHEGLLAGESGTSASGDKSKNISGSGSSDPVAAKQNRRRVSIKPATAMPISHLDRASQVWVEVLGFSFSYLSSSCWLSHIRHYLSRLLLAD
jgi:hypothetical protein